MQLSEFYEQNKDILLDRIAPDELLRDCTPGTVFFMVSVGPGKRPQDERNIAYAKYAMPINLSVQEHYVQFLCLTDGGYPKIQAVYPSDLESTDGYKTLFRVKPMAPDDPRAGKHWKNWATVMQIQTSLKKLADEYRPTGQNTNPGPKTNT